MTGFPYGFNSLYRGDGAHIQSLLSEVLDLTNIDTTSPLARRQKRLEVEDAVFDEDRYMCDYMEDDIVCRLVAMQTMYQRMWRQVGQCAPSDYRAMVDSFANCEIGVVAAASPGAMEPLAAAAAAAATSSDMASLQTQVSPVALAPLTSATGDVDWLAGRMASTLWMNGSASLPTPAPSPDRIKTLEPILTFTTEEQDAMMNLPRKQCK